jgi:hypothetical protein
VLEARTMKIPHLILALLTLLPACSRSPGKAPSAQAEPSPTALVAAGGAPLVTSISGDVAGATSKDDQVVGAPKVLDNLTLFPITAKTQVDVGPLITLDEALSKGVAEIREVGADPPGADQEANAAPVLQQQQVGNQGPGNQGPGNRPHAYRGGGARVNTLVIENKGLVPVYVLAGTVVKGGNQDRQIGQDFIIDGKQVASVDAFCVEHGRWTGERDGRATGGKFGTMAQLTTSGVRTAGQYKKNQGEVWAKVADVNTANKKSAASGTLMATLDDAEVVAQRGALAAQAGAFLDSVSPGNAVVGLAYAIDGKVRSVRWFANHAIFSMYRSTLINTAAVDAITARAQRVPGEAPPVVAPLGPEAVSAFIAQVSAAKVDEKRDTAAGNINEYQQSATAYGSKTMMKARAAGTASPGAPPAPAMKAVPISADFVAT